MPNVFTGFAINGTRLGLDDSDQTYTNAAVMAFFVLSCLKSNEEEEFPPVSLSVSTLPVLFNHCVPECYSGFT